MIRGPTRFVVIGDATLDVIVRGDAPEAGADRPAQITVGPGGQGANVAVRLARAGNLVTLVSAFADDEAGHVLRSALAEDGVTVLAASAAHTGLVVALVDGTGDRSMLSDRAPIDERVLARPEGTAILREADWLHVSGYPLADPEHGSALATVVGARPVDQRCSVGGGSFDGVRPAPADLVALLREAHPDLLHLDRAEAHAIVGTLSGSREGADALAVRVAQTVGGVAVVTDGAAGAAAATGEGSVWVEGIDRPTADATGAGDAHAAAILHFLGPRSWPPNLATLREAFEVAGAQGAAAAGVVGAQARTASEGP